MSAFCIGHETMNAIVHYIATEDTGEFCGIPTDEPRIIGDALYVMNECALIARYGIEEAPEMMGAAKSWRYRESQWKPPAIYKAICCLLYQCSEGDVPNSEMFKALLKIRHRLADAIITEMPDYDNAPWGD